MSKTYRPNNDWFQITNKTEGGRSTARLDIYDEIGYWGTDTQTVARQLRGLEADRLDVHINSNGGDAFAGIAIMNILRDFPGDVTVTIDGIAASAASVIAMGGDKIVMNRGSQMMIHDASGFCYGDAAEMAKMIESLDVVSDSIADAYAARAGGSREEWRAVMKTEQWYRADEAVGAGLADEVVGDKDVEISNQRFGIFNFAGRDEAPEPFIPKTTHEDFQAEPGKPKENTRKEDTMSDALKNGIRERLGMTAKVADITDDMFLAALDEALNEGDTKVEAHLPEGTSVIETAVLEQIQADAAAGRAALEAQETAAREARVDAAVKAGKIPPARREHWINALKADEEGAGAVLDSLEPGLIPLAAVGVDHDPEMTEDDKTYNALFGEKKKEA